jgi:hypothetical protein
MSTWEDSTVTERDSRHPSPPIARESLFPSRRYVDTYEIWASGTCIEPEILKLDTAIEKALDYSGGYSDVIFFVFYSGTYTEGPNKPRPLAACMRGERLPMPSRVLQPVAGETTAGTL